MKIKKIKKFLLNYIIKTFYYMKMSRNIIYIKYISVHPLLKKGMYIDNQYIEVSLPFCRDAD